MNYNIASASLIGGREENQDFFRYSEFPFGLLIVVCDGMGGSRGGKEAAELATDHIFREVSHHTKENPVDQVNNAIGRANLAIYRESSKNPWLSGMGTTVAALLITDKKAYGFHVGDSRIYQIRKEKILFRTFDHSRVFEMVHLGLLTEEEARISPMSNIITKVLGTESVVEITCSPDLLYEYGDRFLLCTDGIWNPLPENKLIKMISTGKSVSETLDVLTAFIENLGKKRGGRYDNMTAVLVEIQ
jgi:protein phosphatase